LLSDWKTSLTYLKIKLKHGLPSADEQLPCMQMKYSKTSWK